jgi:NACHT domain-containing protein
MTRRSSQVPGWAHALLPWLIGAGVGPAVVALPINWAADSLAGAAKRWFQRMRKTDDLSRLVKAATGTEASLSRDEFDAVRRLLEKEQTWKLLGRGSVDDLTTLIASVLPPRDSKTGEDSRVAAFSIARGLLEFAVADLEPTIFQQVLLARLQRMENNQADAIDDALLALQTDLIARLRAQGELDTRRFIMAMGHLNRILDRLPPGPASVGEIAIYLRVLIDWLNIDPWPRRFDVPALTPADIERRLSVTAELPAREDDLDADELARTCRRLVILGDPGSGKTWLARRTARICAERAFKALTMGGDLTDIEVPLYTTCSRLFSTNGDIRNAIVSSALDQIGDLGGERITAALRAFFVERNAPTLLVVDSLDEAPGSDERLRQADTLPWRMILTSRPSSWNDQLDMKEDDPTHCVGKLRPLRYPDDVEAFIRMWFAALPNSAQDLVAQIRRRPDLQNSAAIPLILAFYCIIGGNEQLPKFRRDLYAKVLKRMLTGSWRGADIRRMDADGCLRALRAWPGLGQSVILCLVWESGLTSSLQSMFTLAMWSKMPSIMLRRLLALRISTLAGLRATSFIARFASILLLNV